jgi:hypothetical protein
MVILGGVEELEEDDLLDDDDPKDYNKENDDQPKKDNEQEPKDGKIYEPSDKQQGGNSSAGGKSVKRALLFEDDCIPSQIDVVTINCASLLGAMELEGDEIEDEDVEDDSLMELQEDRETIQLPDEMVYDLQSKNQSFLVMNTNNNIQSTVDHSRLCKVLNLMALRG